MNSILHLEFDDKIFSFIPDETTFERALYYNLNKIKTDKIILNNCKYNGEGYYYFDVLFIEYNNTTELNIIYYTFVDILNKLNIDNYNLKDDLKTLYQIIENIIFSGDAISIDKYKSIYYTNPKLSFYNIACDIMLKHKLKTREHFSVDEYLKELASL